MVGVVVAVVVAVVVGVAVVVAVAVGVAVVVAVAVGVVVVVAVEVIKALILTWECCHCHKTTEMKPQLERLIKKTEYKHEYELIPISTELYWIVPENWVRDHNGKMYCPECHMKKEPK